MVLDIWSRYVVGWMLARSERAKLAEALLADSMAQQRVIPAELTIHADRGTSMASKPVAFLLADLGVTKSHSPTSLLPIYRLIRACSSSGYALACGN